MTTVMIHVCNDSEVNIITIYSEKTGEFPRIEINCNTDIIFNSKKELAAFAEKINKFLEVEK